METQTRTLKAYRFIAGKLAAIENCENSGNAEWLQRHSEELFRMIKETAPSGSGIDSGTKLDDRSTPEKLVFTTSYHHMDDSGGYDGWTEHIVTVKGSLLFGMEIKIDGRNRNEIKDYLHDVFHSWLDSDYVEGRKA